MSSMKIHYWMHLITRISLKKSIEVHFNRSKIFLLYHYYANDVNMRKKKFGRNMAYSCRKNVLQKISSFYQKKQTQLKTKQLKQNIFKSIEIYGFLYTEDHTCDFVHYQHIQQIWQFFKNQNHQRNNLCHSKYYNYVS